MQKNALGPKINLLLPEVLSPLKRKSLETWMASVSARVEHRRPFSRRHQRDFERRRDQREMRQLQMEIWLESLPSTPFAHKIENLLQTTRQDVQDYWELRITNGSQFVVGEVTSSQRLFGIRLQPYHPPTHAQALEELQMIDHAIQYVPLHTLEILAFDEQTEDQYLMAGILVDLLYHLGGWVACPMRPQLHTKQGRAEWSIADSQQLIASFGGQAHAISSNPTPYFLVDADCLTGWQTHPKFYMG